MHILAYIFLLYILYMIYINTYILLYINIYHLLIHLRMRNVSTENVYTLIHLRIGERCFYRKCTYFNEISDIYIYIFYICTSLMCIYRIVIHYSQEQLLSMRASRISLFYFSRNKWNEIIIGINIAINNNAKRLTNLKHYIIDPVISFEVINEITVILEYSMTDLAKESVFSTSHYSIMFLQKLHLRVCIATNTALELIEIGT